MTLGDLYAEITDAIVSARTDASMYPETFGRPNCSWPPSGWACTSPVSLR